MDMAPARGKKLTKRTRGWLVPFVDPDDNVFFGELTAEQVSLFLTDKSHVHRKKMQVMEVVTIPAIPEIEQEESVSQSDAVESVEADVQLDLPVPLDTGIAEQTVVELGTPEPSLDADDLLPAPPESDNQIPVADASESVVEDSDLMSVTRQSVAGEKAVRISSFCLVGDTPTACPATPEIEQQESVSQSNAVERVEADVQLDLPVPLDTGFAEQTVVEVQTPEPSLDADDLLPAPPESDNQIPVADASESVVEDSDLMSVTRQSVAGEKAVRISSFCLVGDTPTACPATPEIEQQESVSQSNAVENVEADVQLDLPVPLDTGFAEQTVVEVQTPEPSLDADDLLPAPPDWDNQIRIADASESVVEDSDLLSQHSIAGEKTVRISSFCLPANTPTACLSTPAFKTEESVPDGGADVELDLPVPLDTGIAEQMCPATPAFTTEESVPDGGADVELDLPDPVDAGVSESSSPLSSYKDSMYSFRLHEERLLAEQTAVEIRTPEPSLDQDDLMLAPLQSEKKVPVRKSSLCLLSNMTAADLSTPESKENVIVSSGRKSMPRKSVVTRSARKSHIRRSILPEKTNRSSSLGLLNDLLPLPLQQSLRHDDDGRNSSLGLLDDMLSMTRPLADSPLVPERMHQN